MLIAGIKNSFNCKKISVSRKRPASNLSRRTRINLSPRLNLYGGKIDIKSYSPKKFVNSSKSHENNFTKNFPVPKPSDAKLNRFKSITPYSLTPTILKKEKKIVSESLNNCSNISKNDLHLSITHKPTKDAKTRYPTPVKKRFEISKKYNKSLSRFFNEKVDKLILKLQ
jgi:hypothetical protein